MLSERSLRPEHFCKNGCWKEPAPYSYLWYRCPYPLLILSVPNRTFREKGVCASHGVVVDFVVKESQVSCKCTKLKNV